MRIKNKKRKKKLQQKWYLERRDLNKNKKNHLKSHHQTCGAWSPGWPSFQKALVHLLTKEPFFKTQQCAEGLAPHQKMWISSFKNIHVVLLPLFAFHFTSHGWTFRLFLTFYSHNLFYLLNSSFLLNFHRREPFCYGKPAQRERRERRKEGSWAPWGAEAGAWDGSAWWGAAPGTRWR